MQRIAKYLKEMNQVKFLILYLTKTYDRLENNIFSKSRLIKFKALMCIQDF